MKSLFFASIAAAVLLVSPASAEPRNDTPRALACMKKFGFTYAQWRAYSVPASKANPYRACRDSGH